MKRFKLNILTIFAVIFSLSLVTTSCGDDDDVTDGGGGGNTEDVRVSGFLTEDQTWTNDRFYILEGKTYVQDGVTLTIEPGTIIKGAASSGANASALIVAQGGKVIADGSAAQPIIFTAEADNIALGETRGTNLDVSTNSLWGGVLVLGKAKGSFSGDAESIQIEGLPATEPGSYGGTDDNDNSGVYNYISIRHGGAIIGSDNEINGFTLGAVGSGTQISNIEVVANKDDGIELFGGTVDINNAVVWGCADDQMDVDEAYSGTLTNIVTIQENFSDHAWEIDGPAGSFQAGFTANNVTMIGDDSETVDGVSGNREYADLRDGALATMNNVYVYGFLDDADVEFDDQASSDNYTSGDTNFSNWQVVLPGGQTITEMWNDTAANPSTVSTDALNWTSNVTEGNQTVGANLGVFGWSFASANAAIDGGSGDPVTEVVSGFLEEDQTWTNDRFWLLDGKTYVQDGVTLTIEPGTIIKGATSSGANASALIVAQGGKVIADGTAQEPIIFTAQADNIELGQTSGTNLNVEDNSLWGGVLVLGKAKGSFSGDAVSIQIEGLPATEPGSYGGTDDADNSGVYNYLSIRHGGAIIGSDNEINGFTLGAVGSGTQISNIEVVGNKDDGIELFGGTVDITNALVWGCADDQMDVDEAYSGTLSNILTIQENFSDHAWEIDGPAGSFQAGFTANNVTMIGDNSATVDGVSGNREYADLRDGALATMNNVYAVGFLSDADVELDGQASSDNYTSGDTSFSNWEVVLPSGATITGMWNDTAANPSTLSSDASNWTSDVTAGNQTVGADTSVYELDFCK